jgi:hypothetical protein
MLYIHSRILFSHKGKNYYVICSKVGGAGSHHLMQNRSDTERQVSHVSSNRWKLNFFKRLESRIKTISNWEGDAGVWEREEDRRKADEHDQWTIYMCAWKCPLWMPLICAINMCQ